MFINPVAPHFLLEYVEIFFQYGILYTVFVKIFSWERGFLVISKELKRLSRRELVDIIYQLKKEEQEKQEKIAALEAALAEKRLRIASAGSVAEAAAEILAKDRALNENWNLHYQI